MENSDWNVARDLDKLRELTRSPGGVPSRWMRQMAAEIIRLREENESLMGRYSQATTDLVNHVDEVERLRAALLCAYSLWSHAQTDVCETADKMADLINETLKGSGEPQSAPIDTVTG